MLTPPMAEAFWDGSICRHDTLADQTRKVYTGNGQTYSLYILYYFILLYIAGRAVAGI